MSCDGVARFDTGTVQDNMIQVDADNHPELKNHSEMEEEPR